LFTHKTRTRCEACIYSRPSSRRVRETQSERLSFIPSASTPLQNHRRGRAIAYGPSEAKCGSARVLFGTRIHRIQCCLMRRRLLTIASVVSLLLCAATVMLWVRSSWWFSGRAEWEHYVHVPPESCHRLSARWGSGGISLYFLRVIGRDALTKTYTNELRPGPPRDFYFSEQAIDPEYKPNGDGQTAWQRHNFDFNVGAWRTSDGRWASASVAVPFWLVAFCGALLPAAWLLGKLRQTRRAARNHCERCNYDLTGNTSDVCPECGTAVKTTRRG